MRRLNVRRAVDDVPQQWELRYDHQAVWYTIEIVGPVGTSSGEEMLAVRLRQRDSLSNPDKDVALLVGKIMQRLASGTPDPNRPELWFWNDRFWVRAVAGHGEPYRHKDKSCVFHSVELENQEGLFETLQIPG